MIRKMHIEDIPQVQEIDKLCFNASFYRRTEGIKAYLEENDFTSIVYELDNKIIGYNFIHIWGNFAWFGAFGVHPKYQGREIGKKLVKETIRILKNDFKITNIGLNTMPNSTYNLGFYMNLGFTPLKLNLNFVKELSEKENLYKASSSFELIKPNLLIETDRMFFVQNIKKISNNISEGLDLSSALHLIIDGKFGNCIALKYNNEIKGFALYTIKNIREIDTNCIDIRLLCVNEDVDCYDAIDAILMECFNLGKKIGYDKIHIDCNTTNNDICMYLMKKHGFKVEKSMVAMIMGDEKYIEKYKGLVLCRWAG